MTGTGPSIAVPRTADAVLRDIICITGEVLAKPHVAFARTTALTELAVEIDRAVRTPADGERLIDCASAMLVQALLQLAYNDHRERWLSIAEELRRHVQHDFERALRPRWPSTTEQHR